MFSKNKKIKIAASCIALLLVGSILTGVALNSTDTAVNAESSNGSAASELWVDTVMPEAGEISVVSEYIGVIESAGQATVFPKVSGEVLFVHFNEGDTVSAGDILFEIDSSALQSAFSQSQTALSLAQSRADQNLSMAINNLNNFNYNVEHGHDMTIRNALNAIDNAYTALNNALINSNNAAISVEAAAIAGNNAAHAVSSAEIASNNIGSTINSAEITSGNAELAVNSALGAQNNARIAVDAAENRLNSATVAFNIARRQLRDFVDEGIYPISMIQLQAAGVEDQVEEQLRDARAHALLAVEAAELGVEQARNAYELATVSVEQAKNTAGLSEINLEQAKSAADSTDIGIRQARNAVSSTELNIEQARNGVALSELSVEQAELNLRKAYEAYETALIMVSQQQGNVAMQVEQARINTNFSDQQIALARMEDDLKNFTITAPISGVIERRNVDPFNIATPQAPAFIISDNNGMVVSFRVPRSAYTYISLGDEIIFNDGFSDYTAIIAEMSATVDMGGLFTVKARIKDSSATLLIGASVRVSVGTQNAENTVLIPINAVYYDNGAPYVYIIENELAKKIYIETGIFDSQYIQVLSGVSTADRIIITWSARLADGVSVALISEMNKESENE
ncbi:MAG: efflux RND transporter periplasmic adaptor subunit [Oscillospiraceae bacterium]|jgi:RND family efflux transporter MFP subunit|nr:efflux RND transporter periplasmic adaptor subunit [Oscillospiraceae bacterium]